jgi:hypothetical protein
MSNKGSVKIGNIGGDLSGNVAGGDIIQGSIVNIGSGWGLKGGQICLPNLLDE